MKTIKVLHTPDNGSAAAVIKDGPLGLLYIQVIDAYGFQRELSIVESGSDNPFTPFTLKVYQHPGRRDQLPLEGEQAEALIERIQTICERHPHVLFNCTDEERGRCAGFVRLCEQIHLGALSTAEIVESL